MIDIPVEDSDYEKGKHQINAKGLRVYMPRTDASKQWLIQTLVRHRDRQQDAINDFDSKYVRKYPLGVGLADPKFLQGTIWIPAGIAVKRAADAITAAGAGGSAGLAAGGGGDGSGRPAGGGDDGGGGDSDGHH